MLTNQQAIEITNRSGGIHQVTADENTNCVVIGAENLDAEKIDSLISRDRMQVLSESEFLGLIGF
jgi:hypothetical protein